MMGYLALALYALGALVAFGFYKELNGRQGVKLPGRVMLLAVIAWPLVAVYGTVLGFAAILGGQK